MSKIVMAMAEPDGCVLATESRTHHSRLSTRLGRSSSPYVYMARLLRRRGLAFMPTPATSSTVMAMVSPFEHNLSHGGDSAMLVVPPLLKAIRGLDESSRPLRIVSHETDDGRAFNCAYFDSSVSFANYRNWFVEKAITPGGEYHAAHQAAFEDPSAMPSAESWLWGVGERVLSDTRFGKYQLGMGTRYSRMLFPDAHKLNPRRKLQC